MAPNGFMVHVSRLSRRRIVVRLTLAAVFLLWIAFIIATPFWLISSAPNERPARKDLNKALLAAIRDGNHETVEELLDRGANVQVHNEVGDTALMQAALNADQEMVQLLLRRGADVRARGVYDVTALLRALHDPNKVQLLLHRGARVDERAMVLAA